MCIVLIAGMIIVSTPLVPYQWQLTGNGWAVILPLASVFPFPECLSLNSHASHHRIVCTCHLLFPVSTLPFIPPLRSPYCFRADVCVIGLHGHFHVKMPRSVTRGHAPVNMSADQLRRFPLLHQIVLNPWLMIFSY